MSCGVPEETLSVCKHQVPVKYGCHLCIEERIKKLENIMLNDEPTLELCPHMILKSLPCFFCSIEERINKLEEHKIRQIDENRKVSKRMDELFKKFDFLANAAAKNKKPHKCSMCNGIGGFYISGIMDEECSACEGSGLVLG